MSKSRKSQWSWLYSPAKDPRTKVSAALNVEVERKAHELIENHLKAKYVQQPPEKPRLNYVIGLSTKWHGRYFYFVATYACPFPDAVSQAYEVNFARLEHTATGRFNLAFLRHTGKWHDLYTQRTLDECLAAVRDDSWFQP